MSDRARPVPFSARRHLTPSAPMPSARPMPPAYRFDEGEDEQTRLMPAKNFSTLPPPPASTYDLEVGAGPESAARPLRMRVHRPSTDLAPRPLPPPPARTDEHTSYRPSSTTTRPPPAVGSNTQRSLGAPPPVETASPTPSPVTYAPPTYASTPGEPMLPIMLQQPIVLGASSFQQLTPDQIQAQIEAARSRQGHLMAAAPPQPWSVTQPPRAPDSGVIEVQGIAMSSPHLVVNAKRPASTWAVALVTMGLLGGLVAAVLARGDANGFVHSAMAYVEPAQAKASVASVGASTPASTPAAAAQPAAPTPEQQLLQPEPPPAPPAFDTPAPPIAKADKADKADKPEKSETRHERVARSSHASAPSVAPRPAPAPAPIAMPTPLADKPVAEKPLPTPTPIAVAEKPEKPSKSKKAPKATSASDSDLESAAAADALAKAQLDQSLK